MQIFKHPDGYWRLSSAPVSEEAVSAYYQDDEFWNDAFLEQEAREHEAGYWFSGYRFQQNLLTKVFRTLDVGCGAGWYLSSMPSGMGTGVEPSPKARRLCNEKGVLVYDDIATVPGWVPFGAVRASLVLEHVFDPVKVLQSWTEFLPARGKMLLIVPNEMNPLQKRIGGNWWICDHHLNYFTPGCLIKVARKADLICTYQGATFPMELFILAGFDYRGNDELGHKCHMLRLRWEKILGSSVFHLYGLLHRRFGWGRELLYVFDKVGC